MLRPGMEAEAQEAFAYWSHNSLDSKSTSIAEWLPVSTVLAVVSHERDAVANAPGRPYVHASSKR